MSMHRCLVILLAVAGCTSNPEPSTLPIAHQTTLPKERDLVQRADELLAASIVEDFGPLRLWHPSQRMRARALELLAIACFEHARLDGCTKLMNYKPTWERDVIGLYAEQFCKQDPASGFCKLTQPAEDHAGQSVCDPAIPPQQWTARCRDGCQAPLKLTPSRH